MDKTVVFTTDIDWAPDDVCYEIVKFFNLKNVPFTAFCTHKSDFWSEIGSEEDIEIGIHPDFSRNDNYLQCINSLLELYPQTVGSRSHRNMDGRPITDALKDAGLSYHSNKILFGQKNLKPLVTYNGLIEIPYYWEDGYHLELNLPLSKNQINIDQRGVMIFNVHPMALYLNLSDDSVRKEATHKIKDLTKTNKHMFESFINHSRGIRDLTSDLIDELREEGYKFGTLRNFLKI
jgi:hypothetical protein